MLTATVGYSGSAQATIQAIQEGGGVRFKIFLSGSGNQLVGDLRGLFLDLPQVVPNDTIIKGNNTINVPFSDTESPFAWMDNHPVTGNGITEVQWGEDLVIDLGTGANMNGEDPSNQPPEGYSNKIFDLGIEIGTSGADDYIPSAEFIVDGITLEDLNNQFFGLRLTSTTGTAGSLKLVGKFTDGNTSDDWEGLSPGYWKNWSPEPPGNQVNDWSQDPIIFNSQSLAQSRGEDEGYRTFENVFGINPGGWLISPTQGQASDVSLLQALQLGADLKNGLKRNVLARQATAALLNSFEKDEADPNGAVNYRFSSTQVLDWTKSALTTTGWSTVDDKVGAAVSGFDTSTWTTQQSTIFGLADLFAQNNNLGLYA